MFGLATSPSSPARSLADLKGRSLAVARQTIVDFLADVFLEAAGRPDSFMTRRDIRKIPVRLQMLIAGQVDAALFPEPLLSIVEQAGGRVIMDDRGLDMPLAVVALRAELADAERVRAFRAALVRAALAVNADQARSRALLLELRLIPPQLGDSFRMPPVDLDKVPHRLPSRELFDAYVAWLVKNGVLAEPGGAAPPDRPAPPRYEETVWADDAAPLP
jgi:NitT/TauT family transport system substrate-binding protein